MEKGFSKNFFVDASASVSRSETLVSPRLVTEYAITILAIMVMVFLMGSTMAVIAVKAG